jgi:hypothetical protein
LVGKDELYGNYLWLANMLEVTARQRPDTAKIAPFVREILPDPLVPF